jgi:hypothetical protein
MNKQLIFAIDFDGTCVKHRFPDVGEDVPNAEKVIKRIVESGHKVILWTMRSNNDKHPEALNNAVRWFVDKGILLSGINNNPTQKSWTNSPKAYANYYIDDAALGCPLVNIYAEGSGLLLESYVDWLEIEIMLDEMGFLR